MNNIKIDDALIFEILKFVNDSPDSTTTLRDIVDNTTLSDYATGNTAISEISTMGLLAARAKNGVITVTLDARGCGKLFIDNYRLVSRLTSKEKSKERVWGLFPAFWLVLLLLLLRFISVLHDLTK